MKRASALAEFNTSRRGQRPPNFGKRYPPEVLTREEVLALLDSTGRGSCGVRNRALWVLLWRAGLRVTEALSLLPKDVDTAAGTVRVLHGKGDHWRLVGVDRQALAVLELWLAERKRLGVGPRAPIFCNVEQGRRGMPMRAQQVRASLKRAAEKAGIEKRVHPHGLRHTHAYELATEGKPLHLIRKQLGHTSLATTERYIDHLAPAEVVAAMQSRSWTPDDHAAAP